MPASLSSGGSVNIGPVRRLVILLLAVVIPFKAWAGVAHALTLAPGHGSALAAVLHVGGPEHGHSPSSDADDCCADMLAGGALDSHECPHLAMPLIAAPALLNGFTRIPAAQPAAPTARLRSVVHDVLLPPPLVLL